MRVEVRDGRSTRIWDKHWVPDFIGKDVELLPGIERGLEWVKDLMTEDGRGWDEHKVRSTFTPVFCNEVLSIKSNAPNREDRWIWSLHSKGIFSVQSTYARRPAPMVIKAAMRDWDAFEQGNRC
ncbi:Unknown protein [Striga hermonthica]|uniref:Uncharacterized protein n=1 Tax=Striga hermonthica TaxID=68872 RepID=A0A9N7MQ78_STRHE|nr:Unknown protein [Striga hermonthica]